MSAVQNTMVVQHDKSNETPVKQSLSNFGLDLGVDTVDIIVGQEPGTAFKVHLNLLIAKVPYFEKMFRGGFREAEERKAHLPDDDPAVFGLFLEWVYRGLITPTQRAKDDYSFYGGLKLYCFAEKICQSDFMDCAITHLLNDLRASSCHLDTQEMIYAYNTTPPSSQLRKFAACSFVWCLGTGPNEAGDWSVEEMSTALSGNMELLKDVMAKLRGTLRDGDLPNPLDSPCDFHHHEKDVDCPYQ